MKTTAIKIEGQIISPEVFDRINAGDLKGQLPSDFGLDKNSKLRDEIARAWADAKDQWSIFKRHTHDLADDKPGTTETRKYWIIPLLENMGYHLSVAKAEIVNDNSFAISHRDESIEGFPVHIVGVNDSLDRRRESGGGSRLSPHALVQEYLNITEHLYAIVTNGHHLRILRDSGKIIRLTYLEFDLHRMLEDDLYAEFSLMFRLIHASRMPQKFGEGEVSLIEQYHQDSLEAGARIRNKLSSAVERSIILVANGFLKHPANQELRERIQNAQIIDLQLYQYLLRFIYRLLFLMVIEERDIIYPVKLDDKTKRQKDIFYKYYSLTRIRKLSENYFFFDEKLEDLWIALRNTFKIFGSENLATKLGIYPLNGDLFDFGSLGILGESNLDNHTLLECIRNLSIFESPDTKSIIRVNYAALNVEEFGSVYEGLLEKAPQINILGSEFRFTFIESTERSSSGSHYTPEELVQPLIKHSLDYVIEDKLKNATPVIARSETTKQSPDQLMEAKEKSPALSPAEALLSIKVCDVACGSGHILLSAARRIALELARVRYKEEQPTPENFRDAIRDVINNCIYGVDKNPLAVELCKVALWLEAHNPGMPLNFLDHKIKCGDSIVGLARIEELQNGIADEAFKTLPGDDKEIAASLRKKNKGEVNSRDQILISDTQDVIDKLNKISTKFTDFNKLPDKTVDAVKKKTEEYNVLRGEDWWKLKEAADVQIAQFFIPKTKEKKELLATDEEYFRILASQKAKHERKIAEAMATGVEKRFFHWFLEFPDVMQAGGFDSILGNPPYLGGNIISQVHGGNYHNYIKSFSNQKGSADLVAYFVLRNYNLIKKTGFTALISTNSISQGATREISLDEVQKHGDINFAMNSIRWPGQAAVIVTLISYTKQKWTQRRYLNNKLVAYINAFLEENETINQKAYILKENNALSFQGHNLQGTGFILEKREALQILEWDPKYREIIFPFLNGKELNGNPDQTTPRYVIQFDERTEEEAKKFETAFKIVEAKVKPERLKHDAKKYPRMVFEWWKFWNNRQELTKAVDNYNCVLVQTRITKCHSFVFIPNNQIISAQVIVFALQQFYYFTLLQSSMHEHWAWKYGSTLKSDRRYSPTDCFETFPFPQNLSKETEEELEKIGEEYHEFRRQLMLDLQLGLTKTYNLFHNPEVRSERLANSEGQIVKVEEIREFKQANLQIPIEEAIERIEHLRELHKQMDEAVLTAYGWSENSEQRIANVEEPIANRQSPITKDQSPIALQHDFYEVDYLPENDRIRYTISPEARKEILKRLLELNHKIHEEEVEAGLWEKGKAKGKLSGAKSRSREGKSKKDTETKDLFGG